ncbi:hypothetical protein AB0M54_16295 [Actinoplanes sp. NPDC051470]|uniref:hypothetical protein n=1 Tax=unclassified Actinoplanes TaxID=2626549 RepID=UPI003440BDC6
MVRRLGWLLVVSLVVGGCGNEEQPDAAPSGGPVVTPAVSSVAPSPTVSAGPAPQGFKARDVDDLGKLCGMPKRQAAGAAAFAGPGPYPTVVFSKDAGEKAYSRVGLERKYQLAYPEDASLLACVTGSKGKRVGRCSYHDVATDDTFVTTVDGQRFTVEVFALATGKRIARKTLTTAGSCPKSLVPKAGVDQTKHVYATLSSEQIEAVVGPYYKG